MADETTTNEPTDTPEAENGHECCGGAGHGQHGHGAGHHHGRHHAHGEHCGHHGHGKGQGHHGGHHKHVHAMFAAHADQMREAGPLREAAGLLMPTIFQVGKAGSEEQVAAAVEVLTDARKKLYAILAQD